MNNDHVPEPFRSILNDLTRSHRAAYEELREGMAALNRVNRTTMPKQRSYDPKCFSLAEDFLDDHRPFTEAEAQDLAQTIQDAIEDWLFFRNNPARDEDAQ